MEWFSDGEYAAFQKFKYYFWKLSFTGTIKKCFQENRKIALLPRRFYSRTELIIISMHRTGRYSILVACHGDTQKLPFHKKSIVLKNCNHELAWFFFKIEGFYVPVPSVLGHVSFRNGTLSTLLHANKNKYCDFYSETHCVGNSQYYWR